MNHQGGKKLNGWSNSGGCLIIIGLGVTVFSGMALLGGLSQLIIFWNHVPMRYVPVGGLAFSIFFIIIGVLTCRMGLRKRKEFRRRRAIVSIVIDQGHRSLMSIARLLNTDANQTMKEIQEAINRGYLPGFVLNPVTRRIHYYDGETQPSPLEPVLISFKCGSCGAKNQIQKNSDEVRCKYCGTPHMDSMVQNT